MITKESKVSVQACVCAYIYATEKQSAPVHLCNPRTELEELLDNVENPHK